MNLYQGCFINDYCRTIWEYSNLLLFSEAPDMDNRRVSRRQKLPDWWDGFRGEGMIHDLMGQEERGR